VHVGARLRAVSGSSARASAGAGLCAAVALAVGCGGGGNERQDANEPSGKFEVEVTKATFPPKQKLAKRSQLAINVKNTGERTVPNLAVTVEGFDEVQANPDADTANARTTVFTINGQPVNLKQYGGFDDSLPDTPGDSDTAFVDTWTAGPVKPGETKKLRWSVTATRRGPYRLKYEVAAGLDGKAKAVDPDGGPPQGVFAGTISAAAPDTRVSDRDGTTIIPGTR